MRALDIFLIVTASLVLAACGSNSAVVSSPPEIQPTPVKPTQPPADSAQVTETQAPQAAIVSGLQLPELSDSQGAVEVVVRPLDLGSQVDKLTFDVALNTHSVDLSMDLAALSTLTTDTGLIVQASAWDAPRGGHHVSGTLSFPSSVEGKTLLSGASKLTLVIKDVDAPQRSFSWDLK